MPLYQYMYICIYIYAHTPPPAPPLTDRRGEGGGWCPSPCMICQRMGDNHLSQTQFQSFQISNIPLSLSFQSFQNVQVFPRTVRTDSARWGIDFWKKFEIFDLLEFSIFLLFAFFGIFEVFRNLGNLYTFMQRS